MPAALLKPSFVRIRYHSPFSGHLQTIPTRQWVTGIGTHGVGGYVAWDSSSIDADDMINALVALMLPYYRSTVVFDDYTIYDYVGGGDLAFPVAGAPFTSVEGSSGSSNWYEAVQTTFTLFDTDFNKVKLVLLDSDSGNQFLKTRAGDFESAANDLVDEFCATTNAWQSRQGFRPDHALSKIVGLNDALKQQYHQA